MLNGKLQTNRFCFVHSLPGSNKTQHSFAARRDIFFNKSALIGTSRVAVHNEKFSFKCNAHFKLTEAFAASLVLKEIDAYEAGTNAARHVLIGSVVRVNRSKSLQGNLRHRDVPRVWYGSRKRRLGNYRPLYRAAACICDA